MKIKKNRNVLRIIAFKHLHAIPTWRVDLKINNYHMRGPKLKIFHIMKYLNLDVTLITILKKVWQVDPNILVCTANFNQWNTHIQYQNGIGNVAKFTISTYWVD
jgi:hypothetical protein